VLARTTASGGLLDADRLERAFEASHTTSPAGAILASTDAARALLERDGQRLSARLLRQVARARAQLRAVPGLEVLDGPQVDPAKLVVLPAGTGAHGHAVEADLLAAGLPLEMADRDALIPMITFADRDADVQRLVTALTAAVERHRGTPRRPQPSPAWNLDPDQAMPPREAFFADHETVPAERAVGRVSAELVAPYPPGVPVLAPGEVVAGEVLEVLRAALADGGRIAYAADPTLATLQVVR
jgi:arginine decarboxylase